MLSKPNFPEQFSEHEYLLCPRTKATKYIVSMVILNAVQFMKCMFIIYGVDIEATKLTIT